jgi:hypothetical protein
VDGGDLRSVFAGDIRGDDGCAFILDEGGICGDGRRPGSPYCEVHHWLCHIPSGSTGEERQLREAEVLASAVGGRRGRLTRMPPDRFLRRLELIARASARPKCSCIVRQRGKE